MLIQSVAQTAASQVVMPYLQVRAMQLGSNGTNIPLPLGGLHEYYSTTECRIRPNGTARSVLESGVELRPCTILTTYYLSTLTYLQKDLSLAS